MLRVLETSHFLLADDTFKVTPKMFYQFYFIHVSFSGIAPSCIYALLPKTNRKNLPPSLRSPKKIAPDSRPEKILLDFQQAAIQTLQ